ncbi:MAG TPA: prolyl oligopeptidase family serine peptidase [Gemmatimonadaceae bacterium]|nr:prolyl oligopeptidase family serine peptidase [Gemmatimonadaceae bacterium]
MRIRHCIRVGAISAVVAFTLQAQQPVTLAGPPLGLPPASFKHQPTIEQFLKPGYPEELESAQRADRIAWLAFEAGKRDVYTAAAPDFKPVRLTNFPRDEGDVLSNTQISADGSIIVFVHGGAPNREGWVANPTADPSGSDREIWAVRSTGGAPAWKVADGGNPELSPDGKWVLFTKDGQIYRAAVSLAAQTNDMNKGKEPFIREWGTQGAPRWSPDGSKIAWVSQRVDHSLIMVYDVKARRVTYLSPSVDFDTSPTWSEDGSRIAFIRRPGLPFGQQAQQGTGSLGNPNGPAFGRGGGGRGGRGGGGRAGGGEVVGRGAIAADDRPGLYTAKFADGSNLSFWVADPVTGQAQEFWHNLPAETVFNGIGSIEWAGTSVLFQLEPEEWTRWYAVPVAPGASAGSTGNAARPIELTPGDGQVEHTAIAKDGKTLFYTTNYLDRERRHVWRVPTSGGQAEQVTTGDGIETYPAALASGKSVATLSSDAVRPFGVGVWPSGAGQAKSAQKVIYPSLARDFPYAEMVTPTLVITKAADGMEIHNQLFLPKDLKPGEKRPAIIFVHGGPVRQMLLGDHYMWFYHTAYMTNEWLASQGYIVMSVNYRSGIGYGKSFRNAAGRGGAGNSEYQDVLAGGKYLQSRGDVDPKRVGIWGLSYGGVLTSQALARNSDVFVAGVDLAGVHLWGSSLDPNDVSYQSSTISAIDGWKSPVLLIQGDDDRNVAFQQMTGLVQLLRAHNVHYELVVYPDDTHESLLDSRWMYTYARMEAFLDKFLRNAGRASTSQP